MKRLIIIFVCGLVTTTVLLAQGEAPQTPTTQKTSTTTAKPAASQAPTVHKTSATTSKTGTTATQTTSTATSQTATTKPATGKTTPPAAAGKATTAAKPATANTWITTGTGLKYQDVVVGKGPQPKPGDDIVVKYTGRFLDGKVFDPGVRPFELRLGQGMVIKGWDEGLATMHVGGKRKLIIPPNLAYGPGGYPDPRDPSKYVIPPNTTLTFDVELVQIK